MTTSPPSEIEDVLDEAAAAERDRRYVDAIDLLTRANRCRRNPTLERRLVALRHAAFATLAGSPGPGRWPAVEPGEALVASGIPTVAPPDLEAGVLSTAIWRHGCLRVDGLIPHERVDLLVGGIDRAIEARDRHAGGAPVAETTPWYEPFVPSDGYVVGPKRRWVRDAGGVWAADSPRLLFDLIDTLDDVGLPQVISEYFGERPAMSVNKCTLRRVGRTEASPNWHQDGAFLGDGIRSIDVWISLSTCGVDAPGLDVVPRRLDRVVETGTGGAVFDWAVGRAVVEEVAGATGVVRPTFEPGDVLLFDEMLLHNTAVEDSMTRERYAVEAWFFAPSVYPDSQIPLAY